MKSHIFLIFYLFIFFIKCSRHQAAEKAANHPGYPRNNLNRPIRAGSRFPRLPLASQERLPIVQKREKLEKQ